MPRIARMVNDNETTLYHVMSQDGARRIPLGRYRKGFSFRLDQAVLSALFG